MQRRNVETMKYLMYHSEKLTEILKCQNSANLGCHASESLKIKIQILDKTIKNLNNKIQKSEVRSQNNDETLR